MEGFVLSLGIFFSFFFEVNGGICFISWDLFVLFLGRKLGSFYLFFVFLLDAN